MKIQVMMKTPDTLDLAIEEAFAYDDTPETEDETKSDRKAKVRELCEKWFKYGELVKLEIDTEAGTCKVL